MSDVQDVEIRPSYQQEILQIPCLTRTSSTVAKWSIPIERSRRFYTRVLGGEPVRLGETLSGAPANIWIINVDGGPTDGAPIVTLQTPATPYTSRPTRVVA